jgi:hypothetical protein
MKIKAGLTFLINQDQDSTLEITDMDAGITFIQIKLSPEQVVQALSRLSYTRVEAEVMNLEAVGKIMETKNFEFPLPEKIYGQAGKQLAVTEVKRVCPEGWTPDLHFNSQNTFFEKDGKSWARTIIRRWVK